MYELGFLEALQIVKNIVNYDIVVPFFYQTDGKSS